MYIYDMALHVGQVYVMPLLTLNYNKTVQPPNVYSVTKLSDCIVINSYNGNYTFVLTLLLNRSAIFPAKTKLHVIPRMLYGSGIAVLEC